MNSIASPRIAEDYLHVRQFSDRLTEPLSAEDCMVQSMDDVSPTRWHLAHTTWFFETFLLRRDESYRVFDEQYNFLFNSYYNTIGEQFPRPQRGLISRPGLEEIRAYRRHVDEAMMRTLESTSLDDSVRKLVLIGLHHEQQHQELILSDIKHVLSCNPTDPVYLDLPFDESDRSDHASWAPLEKGVRQFGHDGKGFAFDNESPRHDAHLSGALVCDQLVTCGDYIEFMEDGGYERPELWLSLGWAAVQQHGWQAPLYWRRTANGWAQFTLSGLHPVNLDWPVAHVSLFEADAFARWKGKRLPTEFEWEAACANSLEKSELLHTCFVDKLLERELAVHPTRHDAGYLGGVWQWTSSSYAAYPGYRPAPGAVGEYNGKFMCNQYVLRGGSVATSQSHIRPTYRNFFPADIRWQFAGIRLADDA